MYNLNFVADVLVVSNMDGSYITFAKQKNACIKSACIDKATYHLLCLFFYKIRFNVWTSIEGEKGRKSEGEAKMDRKFKRWIRRVLD